MANSFILCRPRRAGIPRANRAVAPECPGGTIGAPTDKTVLQQHCAFWDEDQARALLLSTTSS